MEIEQLKELARLLKIFRDDAFDQEEYGKRTSLLFDVLFEIKANGDEREPTGGEYMAKILADE